MVIPKKRVLVVDDNQNWRELLRDLLLDEFDVQTCEDYQLAIQKIETQIPPFHVVITDIRLVDIDPDNKDGVKIVERVNQMGEYTKTIVVTGYPSIDTAIAVTRAKAEKYYSKSSVNNEEFVKTVREAANEAEQHRCAFVVMPFANEYDGIWAEIFKITKRICMNSRRADDSAQSRVILSEIVDGIRGAGLVISDLSGKNLNVLFETGIAHAMYKCVILLIQKGQKTSQFLAVQRYLTYENTIAGAEKIGVDLSKAIQAAKEQNYPPIFKKIESADDPLFCMALVQKTVQGQDTFDTIIKPVISEKGWQVENCLTTYKEGIWIENIWSQLNRARLVIADLSGGDPDVFYLAGLAYGLRKKMIILSNNPSIIPFDLKANFPIIYSKATEEKRQQARNKLTRSIGQLPSI